MTTPFTIHVSEDEIRDLRYRLMHARLPDVGPVPVAGALLDTTWGAGTPLEFMKQVQKYWLDSYDWRKFERKLNSFDNYKCTIPDHENIVLHVIHQKTHVENKFPLPILLLHGWPGSVWEFHRVIPQLINAGFDVVCPSLPGYGFSEAPKTPGWDSVKIASVMNSLMTKVLNYKTYFSQGGDWGGIITKNIGAQFPKQCVAIHLNMFPAGPPKGMNIKKFIPEATPEELQQLNRLQHSSRWEFAYQKIQGTRPQSLGYGMNDSPIGLAAWIMEKFSAWLDTRPDRDPLRAVSMDDMLTNISIYWFTQSITSSFRLYYEDFNRRESVLDGKLDVKVEVPTGLCQFPEEIFLPPDSWVKHTYNVVHWTKNDKGGHFAALEQPDILANDIIKFFSNQLTTSKM